MHQTFVDQPHQEDSIEMRAPRIPFASISHQLFAVAKYRAGQPKHELRD